MFTVLIPPRMKQWRDGTYPGAVKSGDQSTFKAICIGFLRNDGATEQTDADSVSLVREVLGISRIMAQASLYPYGTKVVPFRGQNRIFVDGVESFADFP